VPESRLLCVRDRVREALSAVTPAFPWPLAKSPRTAEFDRTVGRVLYETMDIVPADAASEEVWSFMTLVLLPEVGPWRFPGAGTSRYLGVPRNVLRRTWWRAHVLGPDLGGERPGSPPLGEDELVQIFERPTLAGNPWVARAIVATVHAVAPGLTVARSEFVRDLTRRLLRLTPLVSLDALEEDELSDLLCRLAEDSRRALEGRPSPVGAAGEPGHAAGVREQSGLPVERPERSDPAGGKGGRRPLRAVFARGSRTGRKETR
jgi:hypothetical protein